MDRLLIGIQNLPKTECAKRRHIGVICRKVMTKQLNRGNSLVTLHKSVENQLKCWPYNGISKWKICCTALEALGDR